MQYIHTMAYCLAIKRNEVVIHAITRINLENITLSEKKPVTESHILYDFLYTKYSE